MKIKLNEEEFLSILKKCYTITEFMIKIGYGNSYHQQTIDKLNQKYDCNIQKQIKENKLNKIDGNFICKECGKEFHKKYSRWSNGDFCCKECARKYSQKSLIKRNKKAKCIICNKDIEIDIRASIKNCKCNECKKRVKKRNNKIKNRKIKIQIEKPKTYCLFCGKEIPNGNKYCNSKCKNSLVHKRKMEEVKNNNGINCDIRRIKQYLLETRGHKCEICNNNTWNNQPIPIIIDHINGRALDNRLENLRLVCPNCDAQLPTFKSKNKNSDRKNRKGRWI